MVGLLNAPPGTRLYDRMRKEGRLIGLITGDNVDGSTNILSKMGNAALRDGYRNIMQYIYSPKPYYKRAMTFLRSTRHRRSEPAWTFHHLVGLFRSIVRLGFSAGSGFNTGRFCCGPFSAGPACCRSR